MTHTPTPKGTKSWNIGTNKGGTMMRDMTRREFHAALARRGWRQVMMWIDTGAGRSIGMVMWKTNRGWKTNRRASLAKAIRETA